MWSSATHPWDAEKRWACQGCLWPLLTKLVSLVAGRRDHQGTASRERNRCPVVLLGGCDTLAWTLWACLGVVWWSLCTSSALTWLFAPEQGTGEMLLLSIAVVSLHFHCCLWLVPVWAVTAIFWESCGHQCPAGEFSIDSWCFLICIGQCVCIEFALCCFLEGTRVVFLWLCCSGLFSVQDSSQSLQAMCQSCPWGKCRGKLASWLWLVCFEGSSLSSRIMRLGTTWPQPTSRIIRSE